MKPLVSAVIVNYNGKSTLGNAIKSIEGQSYTNTEIIIVDNNSEDGSMDYVKKNHKGVKLVLNKRNLGYCGINEGLKMCRGKYVFFTNNDISLDRKCIEALVKTLESDQSAGIASPKVVNFFNKKMQSCGTWVSRSFYNGHFSCSKDFRKEIPYNGIALIRKGIVDEFGYLFDGDYFIYAEDLDLGLRIRLLGYNVIHVPDALLYHMHSLTMARAKQYKLTYLMERNLLSTFVKVLSIKSIIIFLPYVFFMRLMGIFKDVITLQFMNAFARIFAIFIVVIKLPKLLSKRIQIQKLRKKEDSFLLKVFSEKYLFSNQKIKV